MKKILFSLFAVAAMLFATSCSQEEELGSVVPGTEVEVSFSAQLPEIATRAYSDGSTVTTLHYAVYVKGSNETVFQDTVVITGNSARVNLKLANSMTYELIFWAQSNKTAAYTLDWTNKSMSIDYSQLKANDENNDAFYKYIEYTVDGSNSQQSVVLTRPFAQINLGTNDLKDAEERGLVAEKTNLVITSTVPNVLDFVDGTVSGEVENATFAANAFAKGENAETFPVEGYDYLGMNYILVDEKELIDCTFNVWKEGEENATTTPIRISNVPVQRNFRTNIYGSLLTNATDFDITIDSDFTTGDYPYGVDLIYVGNNTYEVNSPAGMMKIATMIKEEYPSEAKIITIKMTTDMDMSGLVWTPLTAHWVNFDGQNHTISNLNCGADATAKSGFCGYLGAATIKNLTLHNVTAAGEQAGIIAGHSEGGTLENVTITGVNNVNYKDIATYDESYGGVGAIFGVNVAGERAVDVTIQEGATIYVDKSGLVTEAPAGNKYAMIAGITVTDNGSVKCVETIVDGLLYNAEAKAYEVSTAEGLVKMSELTIKGNEKVLLTANIDLAGIEFAGLNAWNPEAQNTFDGQGFTVSNVTNTSKASEMGFIRNWVGPIKNVTIKNANFKTKGRSAILAAKVYSDIENCHIVGGSIEDSYWSCGAIAGHYNEGNITNCTVDGVTVKSNGSVGGIVGVINETTGARNITNCKVINSTINSTKAYGEAYADAAIVGMVNIKNSVVTLTDCAVENCNISKLYGWAEENTIVVVNGEIYVTDAASFLNAAAQGGTIVLTEDITLDGSKGGYLTTTSELIIKAAEGKSVSISNIGKTGEHQLQSNFTSGNITFEGINFDVPSLESGWAMSSLISGNAKVTFKGCTFSGVQCPIYLASANAQVTIEDCSFASSYIQVEIYKGDFSLGNNLIIKNCDFGNMADVLHIYDYDKDPSSEAIAAYLTENGNTFTGVCKQTCK